MRLVLAIFGVLLIAACQPNLNEGSDGSIMDHTEASCEAAGGRMMSAKVGPVCVMPSSDAGKSCTSSSQCEGLCMANGQCSPDENSFGCQDVLENGQATTICID
jgi:hypothetical protein